MHLMFIKLFDDIDKYKRYLGIYIRMCNLLFSSRNGGVHYIYFTCLGYNLLPQCHGLKAYKYKRNY